MVGLARAAIPPSSDYYVRRAMNYDAYDVETPPETARPPHERKARFDARFDGDDDKYGSRRRRPSFFRNAALCLLFVSLGVALRELVLDPLYSDAGHAAAAAAAPAVEVASRRVPGAALAALAAPEVLDEMREILGDQYSDSYFASLLTKHGGDVAAAVEAHLAGLRPRPAADGLLETATGWYELVSVGLSGGHAPPPVGDEEIFVAADEAAVALSLAPAGVLAATPILSNDSPRHRWYLKDGALNNEDELRTPHWLALDVWSRPASEEMRQAMTSLAAKKAAAVRDEDFEEAARLQGDLADARSAYDAAKDDTAIVHTLVPFKPQGSQNQRWRFHVDGTVESEATGLILAVRETAAGTAEIFLAPPPPPRDAATPAQRWTLVGPLRPPA